MQRNESKFQQVGICNKLFNFIMKSFFYETKQPQSSYIQVKNKDHEPEQGISVIFKESEEMEEPIIVVPEVRLNVDFVNGVQERKTGGETEKEKEKIASFSEKEENKEMKQARSEDNNVEKLIRRRWSVDSNINEKSDAFIRGKMESMRRSFRDEE